MAGKNSGPKPPPKKGFKVDDDSRRTHSVFIPRAPGMRRRVVNPRGNRKGR